MNICINVPSIVYQNSWLGQTSGISSTNIFTPIGEGLFRVTAGAFANTGRVSGDLFYPGPGTSSFSSVFNSGSSPQQQNIPISMVVAGTSGVPLQLDTSVVGSTTYDLFVTIEQLQ